MTPFSTAFFETKLANLSAADFFAYFDGGGRGFFAELQNNSADQELGFISTLALPPNRQNPDHPHWESFRNQCRSFRKIERGNLRFKNGSSSRLKFRGPWLEDRRQWDHVCERLQHLIDVGKLQKAVPCRWRSTALDDELNFRQLLAKVFSETEIPGVHRFLLSSGDSVFFGFTPEFLYERKQSKIFVPAIAGTRKAMDGNSAAVSELINSQKENAEHDLVVDGILSDLRSLGLDPRISNQKSPIRAGNLVHLHTLIEADDPGADSLPSENLIASLHPTAAIGGYPKREAKAFLEQNEGWARGLFSNPLSIRTVDCEFSLIAIRSALVKEGKFWQFAGAGFVAGSDADSEWRETTNKMESLTRFFFEADHDLS